MAQFSRPSSDVSTGGWTATPLWSKLDDNSDADYVDSPSTDGAAFLCACNSVTDPLTGTGYKLRIRARRFGGSAASGDFCQIRVELLEGSTVRVTRTQLPSNSALATYTWDLSSSEANAIANHGNLRVRVTVIVADGSTDNARVAWVELEVPTIATPEKCTNVQATDGTRADGVNVTWSGGAGASSFQLARNTVNNRGTATVIYTGIGGKSKLDKTAVSGTTYYYWPEGVNSAGTGPTPTPGTGRLMVAPSAPTGFTASDSTTEDGVDTSWTAVTGDGTIRYKLRRDGVVILTGLTVPSQRDTTAVAGITYSYDSIAYNDAGDSAASTADNGTRLAGTPPVSTAPTGFTASAGAYTGRVRLKIDEYPDATEVLFYRSVIDSIPNTPLLSGLPGTTTTADDTTPVGGVTYRYWSRVRLSNGALSDPTVSAVGFVATSPIRLYQEFLKAIIDALFKGTASVTDLDSSTPEVVFEGLTSAYEFDPSDVGYSTIPAGAKLGLTTTYDGTDTGELTASDGTLGLADHKMPVAAGAAPVEQLLVYADWSARQPLIAVQDSFYGYPFEVIGGDVPTIEWSRLLPGVFALAPLAGAVVYPYALEQALLALLGGSARHSLPSSAPTLKVGYMTASAAMVRGVRSLSDIPGAMFCQGRGVGETLTAVATANVGTNAAKVTADNATFTAVSASTPTATHALVWIHNTDPRLALPLLLFELPAAVVFDGGNETITWDATYGVVQLGGGPATGADATAGAVATPAISGVPRLRSAQNLEADAAKALADFSKAAVLRADLSPRKNDYTADVDAVKLSTKYCGKEYRNALAGWPQISRSASRGDEIGGAVGETVGDLEIVNERREPPNLRDDDDFGGRLEAFVDDYIWDQKPLELSAVAVRAEEIVAGPLTILKSRTSLVTDVSADGSALAIGIVSLLEQLTKRVQTVRLAGTGGLEGSPEMRGVRPPILLGSPLNVEGLLVATQPNPTYLLHRDSQGHQIQGVTGAYVGANPLTLSTNYTVDLATSTVQITSGLVDGLRVTFDVVGPAATGTTLADVLRYLLIEIGPLSADDLDATDLAILSALAPFPIGWRIDGQQDTFESVLNALTRTWAWWGAKRNGKIGAGISVDPSQAFVDYEVPRSAIRSVRPLAEVAARPAAALGYAKNWTVVDSGGVAGAALNSATESVAERARWSLEPHYRIPNDSEPAFDTLHPSEDPPADYVTPLLNEADARLVQRWVSSVVGQRKKPFVLMVDAQALRFEPHGVASIDWPLHDLAGGVAIRVEQTEIRKGEDIEVEITAWKAADVSVLAADDAGAFYLTDDSGKALRVA